eukprot:gene7556-8393_t
MKQLTTTMLSITLLGLLFARGAVGCGGGSSKCTYTVCSTSWGSWAPGVAQGSCRWQTSKAHHSYRSYEKSSGCSNTPCNTKDKTRYMCSCKYVSHCRWASWGSYTGNIARGTCGIQTRYRYPTKYYSYEYRSGSCNGAKLTCPQEKDEQTRQWCKYSLSALQFRNEQVTAERRLNVIQHLGAVGPETCLTDIAQHRQTTEISTQHTPTYNSKPTAMASHHLAEAEKPIHAPIEDWTVWTLASTTTTGSCPTEERFRHWTTTVAYKGAHANCIGIGPQSCPTSNREERKKDVKCSKLTAPANGALIGSACNGVNSACNEICQVDCRTGYPLQGNRYAVCGPNGQWNRPLGTCQDSIAPTITCPTLAPVANEPNENYAMIELPDAVADDQSGKKPTVTISHTSPLKVTVGIVTKVTYTATDDAGNQKSCDARFEAEDTEAPKVIKCPKDIVIATESSPHTVIWEEPTFMDNVDDTNSLTVKPSHPNGNKFSKGTTNVVYTVHDSAFNEVKCEFKIQISELKCKLYEAPKHGAYSCNINKNGIEELFVCSIACKSNYWFLQDTSIPTLYDFYVCGDDGGWKGQNQIGVGVPTFFENIPKGKTPWPDCSEGNPPAEASKPFTVIGGSCTAQDVATLKVNFITALMTDPIIQSIYCSTNNQNCVIKNVRVHCSSVKRKRNTGSGSSNSLHISFEFYVQDKAPSSNQRSEMTKMTRIINSMSGLGKEIKRVASAQLRTSTVNIVLQEKSAELACVPGSEFTIVNGTGSTTDRSKCVKCPAGTSYNAGTKKCQVCQAGTYQEQDGQMSCKQCPQGFSTHGYGSNNHTSCKKICPPGTYSETGLETCLACPKGLYQPGRNSTSCVSCPTGKGTSKIGSASAKDCKNKALHVKIQSEGCDDPRRTQGCGYTTIKVDGVDRSLHRRGYNFVILDAKTGAFQTAVSFDTHTRHGPSQMYNYVQNLPDNSKIVLIGIQDEASRYMSYLVQASLLKLHGTPPFQTQYRAAFAMIGYKGNTKPAWVKQKLTNRYRGPAMIDSTVALLT